MPNPSLQEQLQALVPASQHRDKENHHKKLAKKAEPKKNAQKPAWLEYTYYGIELLKAHYPACFKEATETQPLKVGIKQDLVKHLSTREDIVIADKSCMIKSLGYYVTTLNYLKCVVEGTARIDLDGNSAGQVTTEEARYSSEQYQAKLQKKTRLQRKDTGTG
jgi:ProP effector